MGVIFVFSARLNRNINFLIKAADRNKWRLLSAQVSFLVKFPQRSQVSLPFGDTSDLLSDQKCHRTPQNQQQFQVGSLIGKIAISGR